MPRFAFIYADGSVFECDEWADAPGRGVQVIVWDDPDNGPSLRHQGDYYRLEGDEPVAMKGENALLQYVCEELGLIKVGYMLSGKQWKEVYQIAKQHIKDSRDG